MIEAKHIRHLPQLFRSPFLRKVALGRYRKELKERLELCGLSDFLSLNLWDIFESVYEILLKHYRCEYVFKNALTEVLLSERCEDTYITDEFRVGKKRVDLAVFSETSAAYEIKTELDSTARLALQANEYVKVFDLVYVITTKAFRPKIEKEVPKTVGLLELSDCGLISMIRDSDSHSSFTNLGVAFDCLRQGEMISITEALTNSPVTVPSSQIYRECKTRFRQLLPFEAHNHVLRHLRMRKATPLSRELLAEVPPSLKHVALTLRATKREIESIRKELNKTPDNKTTPPTKHHHELFSILKRKTERAICA